MTVLNRLLAAFLILFFLYGPENALAVDLSRDSVVATINGDPITLDQVLNHGRQSTILAPYLHVPYGLNRILNDLVQIRLLVLEGQRLEMRREEDDSDAVFAFKVRDRLVRPCPEASPEAKRNYYEANPAVFSTPRYTRARRIGIQAADAVAKQQAAEQLRTLQSALLEGDMDFAEAVAEYSDDQQSKERQGDVGFFAQQLETDPPLAERLHTADIDEFVGPVTQGDMVFLYQITGRHEPMLSPFDDSVAQEAGTALQRECFHKRLDAAIQELQTRWPVDYPIPELAPRRS